MKKIILMTALAIFGFASESNVATIDDMKEAIYKLIVKYNELTGSPAMQDIQNIDEKLREIESRSIQVIPANKRDVYDIYIHRYVEKNRGILMEAANRINGISNK